MKVIRKAKENLFILFIAAAYIAMFIINQNMGIASVKNSFYYIKEMIMIMPVIFVLTALLDLWVPKEKIMKYLLESGYEIIDYKEEGNDVFNISCSISEAVMNGSIEKGIIIDDYGIVPFMVCTKHKKIVLVHLSLYEEYKKAKASSFGFNFL